MAASRRRSRTFVQALQGAPGEKPAAGRHRLAPQDGGGPARLDRATPRGREALPRQHAARGRIAGPRGAEASRTCTRHPRHREARNTRDNLEPENRRTNTEAPEGRADVACAETRIHHRRSRRGHPKGASGDPARSALLRHPLRRAGVRHERNQARQGHAHSHCKRRCTGSIRTPRWRCSPRANWRRTSSAR